MPFDPKSSYYDAGGIEVIEYIEAKLGACKLDPIEAYFYGQLLRYTGRVPFKGTLVRDLEKIIRYAERWRQYVEVVESVSAQEDDPVGDEHSVYVTKSESFADDGLYWVGVDGTLVATLPLDDARHLHQNIMLALGLLDPEPEHSYKGTPVHDLVKNTPPSKEQPDPADPADERSYGLVPRWKEPVPAFEQVPGDVTCPNCEDRGWVQPEGSDNWYACQACEAGVEATKGKRAKPE